MCKELTVFAIHIHYYCMFWTSNVLNGISKFALTCKYPVTVNQMQIKEPKKWMENFI